MTNKLANRSPIAKRRASLHVLSSVLEVQVSHGTLLGGRLVKRLVTDVVYQLRLVVPERNADVVRVSERQVCTVPPATVTP